MNTCNCMPDQTRYITAEDLYTIDLVTDCQISPDGCSILYCVQCVDRKSEKKFSNVWIVTTDGVSQQFTCGDQSDTTPRWSPDGAEIAFISNRDDEKQPQIYIISSKGGEARKVTDFEGNIEGFEWSPDSKKIVCGFCKKDREDAEREKDEQKKSLGVVSRHITRVFFKGDDEGFYPRERVHIWIVDTDTGNQTQLTDHEIYDEEEPSWSPDGKSIVFCSNRSKDPDLDPDNVDLFVMPAEGGAFHKIETPEGPKNSPRFSPDGKWIAYFGVEGKGLPWKSTSLWIVPADSSGPARNLTEDYDFIVSSRTINDLPGMLPMTPPTWSADSAGVYFQVSHHGDTVLKSVSVDDRQAVQTVIGDTGVVGTFTLDKNQSRLAYVHADMKQVANLWIRDMTTKKSQKMTHVNDALFESFDQGDVEEVWFPGASGYQLQGWIIKPPDFDESRKYPSILEIHGGPRVQYGNFFMHEFFFLAACGYVVYFCNPRGGQGYGEEHSRAIWNNWGTVDYEDLMAWADYIEKKEYINKEQMGVTGGSYGGYMTNWIIGHTDRFKAAVTQRSVSNLISMYGSSDLNWSFQHEFGDEPPWENMENYWRQSPLKYVGNVKTPTLIIHSEQDLRSDKEQGLQMFVSLKRMGVDTELVLFPEEPHGLSRKGRTDRRIARLNHIKRWFDRYLK